MGSWLALFAVFFAIKMAEYQIIKYIFVPGVVFYLLVKFLDKKRT